MASPGAGVAGDGDCESGGWHEQTGPVLHAVIAPCHTPRESLLRRKAAAKVARAVCRLVAA